MVSAHGGHKCFIFTMNFNNYYWRPISYILHRCAASTIPVVWRTCRFGCVRNATYSQWILTNVRLLVTSVSQIVLPPLVWDIFTRNSIYSRGAAFTKSRPSNIYTYFQCIFNGFMLMFCVAFPKFTKWERAVRNSTRSTALAFTKYRCA